MDAYSLLQAFKSKALSMGVEYMKAAVTGLDMSADGTTVNAAIVDSGAQKILLNNFVNTAGKNKVTIKINILGLSHIDIIMLIFFVIKSCLISPPKHIMISSQASDG